MQRSALTRAMLAATVVITMALSGCSLAGSQNASSKDGAADSPSSASATGDASKLQLTTYPDPFPTPTQTLRDLQGKPFDFDERLQGKVTLLYFGYANCPDVCPTTMADLAQAVSQLSQEQREKVQVLMVTSDPRRDTPEKFGSWLHQFNPEFTGVTGDIDDIVAAAKSLGIGITPPKKSATGSYEVTHGAQVVAFDSQAKAIGFYRQGFRPGSVAADVPTLLQMS